MKHEDEYRPIACSLHDQLEAAATLRKPVHIAIRTPLGELEQVKDRIVDIFTRDGAEFLKLESRMEIRLDRIETIDGITFGGGSAAPPR